MCSVCVCVFFVCAISCESCCEQNVRLVSHFSLVCVMNLFFSACRHIICLGGVFVVVCFVFSLAQNFALCFRTAESSRRCAVVVLVGKRCARGEHMRRTCN